MAETNLPSDETPPLKGSEGDAAEINDGKVLAAIGYIGILFLVPLLAKKENKYCLHHGKQGAVLFGVEVVGAIALFLMGLILGRMGCAGNLVSSILNVVFFLCMFVLSISGFITALKGDYWKMPIVAPIAEKMKI
jgi:uncharacterized membrane protein